MSVYKVKGKHLLGRPVISVYMSNHRSFSQAVDRLAYTTNFEENRLAMLKYLQCIRQNR